MINCFKYGTRPLKTIQKAQKTNLFLDIKKFFQTRNLDSIIIEQNCNLVL